MLEVAMKYKITNFVHAGDFWNQDAFSYWWVTKEDSVSFDKEVVYSKKIVNSLTSHFKDVRFFLGSDDIRFWKSALARLGVGPKWKAYVGSSRMPPPSAPPIQPTMLGFNS